MKEVCQGVTEFPGRGDDVFGGSRAGELSDDVEEFFAVFRNGLFQELVVLVEACLEGGSVYELLAGVPFPF